MDFFTAMDISASGLEASRTRLNVAASNMANASTTQGADGGPYKRRDVVLSSRPADDVLSAHGTEAAAPGTFAVQVAKIVEDSSPPRMEYAPGNPNANKDGYVAYPNVNVVEEMVDMITASRAYQAGVTTLNAAVSLAERALNIGKGS